MRITRKCPICKKIQILEVDEAAYFNWAQGEKIQDCFPDFTAEQREILQSGLCSKCWDNLFDEMEGVNGAYK